MGQVDYRLCFPVFMHFYIRNGAGKNIRDDTCNGVENSHFLQNESFEEAFIPIERRHIVKCKTCIEKAKAWKLQGILAYYYFRISTGPL